jgi:hypothetical protein
VIRKQKEERYRRRILDYFISAEKALRRSSFTSLELPSFRFQGRQEKFSGVTSGGREEFEGVVEA